VTQIAYSIRKDPPSAKVAAGLALSAVLALGAFAVPAHAESYGRHHDRNYNHRRWFTLPASASISAASASAFARFALIRDDNGRQRCRPFSPGNATMEDSNG
jgi:hypothetical protein